MIVTRQRRRRSIAGRFALPLVALGAFGAALAWPPSHHVIADGPLKPAWIVVENAGSVVVRPLTFAAQQDAITQRNREIRDLNARLEQQRRAKSDADARVQELQQQVTALASQPHAAPEPSSRPVATAASAFDAPAGAAAPSLEEKRLAATWAAMEPEKAAAVVQRLPDDQVTRVLAHMDADSAGAIMNALPAAVAARISRAVAQVQPASVR